MGDERHGEYKLAGGKLTVADVTITAGRLSRVAISGDFFLEPDSVLETIDSALTGIDSALDATAISALIDRALAPDARLFGTSAAAIATAVRRAIESEPAP